MSILEIRKSMNLSQRKFADYFGIPVVNIQHWEQGVSSPPEYVIHLIYRVVQLEQKLSEMEHEDYA